MIENIVDFLREAYYWLLAFHIISVISWMAGMFYLPRLFVYHTRLEVGSSASEMFKEMERKLMRIIINPAMSATWIFGLALSIGQDSWHAGGWFYIKFAAVVLMSGFHGYLSMWRKAFERDENIHSEKYFRMMNEVPTLLMIVIVFMVFIRPFS
ncbi:MAG: protoporphyrinogen oxidase HemJ [Alphaproteobacteria bacterium]|nr:protoporphyrinogen oxidase HemJ [Alphaproteobacteria bacterium]HPF47993.1 protoporphyrinogen oxidase HemJ [Emcibacteraceae bacterium]HRW28839.1 protoporphyrinogen oxidase HemJ [Emcibacteraceae bacterium]